MSSKPLMSPFVTLKFRFSVQWLCSSKNTKTKPVTKKNKGAVSPSIKYNQSQSNDPEVPVLLFKEANASNSLKLSPIKWPCNIINIANALMASIKCNLFFI